MKLVSYKIHTEDLNRRTIDDILETCFSGWTITESAGIWENKPENSIVIEHVGKKEEEIVTWDIVKSAASAICEANKQECCLVTRQDIDGEFVSA